MSPVARQAGRAALLALVAIAAPAAAEPPQTSREITWTCAASPCPWGNQISEHAIVWPAALAPGAGRLGYTASAGVYVSAARARGMTVVIVDGDATIFAGRPDEPRHRELATLVAPERFQLTGLSSAEVVSVQSSEPFAYALIDAAPPPPPRPPDPSGTSSQEVTWDCTGEPCPWGPTTRSEALAWPSRLAPARARLGYLVTAPIYLPAEQANGRTVALASGTATVHAGFPDAPSHRLLARLGAGSSLVVGGLQRGEVLSVQGDAQFRVENVTLAPLAAHDPKPPVKRRKGVVEAVAAYWRCVAPGCSSPDWVGAVIDWPPWAAHHANGRSGDSGRAVFSAAGAPLHPYMGPWATGCRVTSRKGTVLIIEWKRGSDTWRETRLRPGKSHVIKLVAPEDSAMIETLEGKEPFEVSLKSCTPKPLAQ